MSLLLCRFLFPFRFLFRFRFLFLFLFPFLFRTPVSRFSRRPVLSLCHLRERIHDPDSVFRFALKDWLFGFWIKIFKERLLCLLLWICSFIKLSQNTIVTTTSKFNLSLNASHITRISFCEDVRFRFWSLFDTQLMNCFRKYHLLFILDF